VLEKLHVHDKWFELARYGITYKHYLVSVQPVCSYKCQQSCLRLIVEQWRTVPCIIHWSLIAAFRVTRQCAEDVSVKGFTFPKGLVVNIPIYYLHNNPEHWPEPDKFDPNR